MNDVTLSADCVTLARQIQTSLLPVMESKKGILYKIINSYKSVETIFEKMANVAIVVFGNSIIFMAALILVIVWFCLHDWEHTSLTEGIYHVIIAITFLSFFIIQRTFTHFAQAMHLKLNELVTASEHAHNRVIKAELISGAEMREMAKAHDQIIAEEEAPPPPIIISITSLNEQPGSIQPNL